MGSYMSHNSIDVIVYPCIGISVKIKINMLLKWIPYVSYSSNLQNPRSNAFSSTSYFLDSNCYFKERNTSVI